MGKKKLELGGMIFNSLTVIREAEKPRENANGTYWLCRCECGNEIVARGASLKQGRPKSCGCKKSEKSRLMMKALRLKQSGTLQDRFLSRFNHSDNGCWEWNGHKDKDGYGILPTNHSAVRAHRYSIHYFKGVDPSGFVVCHSCDNPSCVNPDHLFLGMPIDNVGDMLAKQRDRMIGSRNNKSKLDERKALEIYNSKDTSSNLASFYGVSVSTIKRIRAKKQWVHIHD